jgi:hypothetical protein
MWYGRAADRARLRLTSRENDEAAIQEGKFSASQPLEIAQNRERISQASAGAVVDGPGTAWSTLGK